MGSVDPEGTSRSVRSVATGSVDPKGASRSARVKYCRIVADSVVISGPSRLNLEIVFSSTGLESVTSLRGEVYSSNET